MTFENTLSKIAAMQKPALLSICIGIGAPLLIAWIISGFASIVFVLPIWIIILFLHPAWLIPLFVAGPLMGAVAIYFYVRFVFWRRAETRSWSHRTLALFILRYMGRMTLFGHGAGLIAILVSLVLRINVIELAGGMIIGFGPQFFDGPVEQALFGGDATANV
ncbi:MAG: hypothetical protein ACOH12_00025 [Parvibaculaceae bacterium]